MKSIVGSVHNGRRDRSRRWGVILAGGDGVRLRPLTRFICGDERPKQFCPLYGGATLLVQALARAGRSISAGQVVVSLNRAHQEFYLRTPLEFPPQRRVVQPWECPTRHRGAMAQDPQRTERPDPEANRRLVRLDPEANHLAKGK